MSVLMRSVSGIRGIVGDTLTPTVLTNHVKAFLEVTGARKVVIGRDSRPTGEAIVSYVSGLCRLAGADVIDTAISPFSGGTSQPVGNGFQHRAANQFNPGMSHDRDYLSSLLL